MKLFLATVLAFGMATQVCAQPRLRAGAAKVDITPAANEFPIKEGQEKPFVGVHDPLFVRALALDDGQRKVVLVSVEVTAIPRAAEVVKAAAQAAGVPEASVMVSATHTHEAPLVFFHTPEPDPTQAREIARIEQAVGEAAREAVARLQPARLAFVRGQAYVNINNGEAAGLTEWNDPTGPSDKSLDVIRVQTADGRPLALVVNYASHSEVMFRSVSKEGGYEVSGDIAGETARLLEDNPKGAPVVLYTAAAEADQLPLFKSLAPAGNLPAADEGAAGWALLDVQSRRLASAVIDSVGKAPAGVSDVRLSAITSSVTCPGQHWRRDPASGAFTAEAAPPVTIPLQLVRIGDIALAGVGGDLGSQIGMAIKAAAPAPHTTVVSMIAGEVGYIFPDSSYAHPGHGLYGSSLKSGCAVPALVNALKAMAGGTPR